MILIMIELFWPEWVAFRIAPKWLDSNLWIYKSYWFYILFLKDELEEILSDKIAKFKYKQQITVFIVGQSEAIEKKNILLEQLNDVRYFSFNYNSIKIF